MGQIIVGLDPGKVTGISAIKVFSEHGETKHQVVAMHTITLKNFNRRDPETYREFSCLIAHHFSEMRYTFNLPMVLIAEWPQVYQTVAARKKNPNDLLHLSAMAAAAYATGFFKYGIFPTPREWKGQTPKKVDNERIAQHYDVEDFLVNIPKTKQNHVLDALAIAAWGAGKMERLKNEI